MVIFGFQLWGPEMETPVEIWTIDEIPMPLSDSSYTRTLLFSTRWSEVYKWAQVPGGEITMNNPIVIAKIEYRGKSIYSTMTNEEFEKKYGLVPTLSQGQRIRHLSEVIELFERAREIFKS